MYKQTITIGVAPTKRSFLSMDEAKRQKDKFMAVIRSIKPEVVRIVDIDDICENGIMYLSQDVDKVIAKMRANSIDALFVPHCDFGEEQVAAPVAAALKVPTLLWGARDEHPNTAENRGRDTQCGMFACSKVMLRYGVKFSYIFNCETESKEFSSGFETFIRTVSVVKTVKGLRIAKIGNRPGPFMSVMTDEAQLLSKYEILTVPISPVSIANHAKKLIADCNEEFTAYYADVIKRIDFTSVTEENAKMQAALVIAIKQLMEMHKCTVGAVECWSAFGSLVGATPCLAVGELADMGLPLACETDVNGAVTLAILRAVSLGESSPFFADLTIRNPENDNSELLWHCGPFPYSLKREDSTASMIDSNEQWELRKGDITICRFDELNGKFYLFGGEGKATDGPKTSGTYVWLEVDDWRKWEEHLIFGPYIHHVGGIYGNYKRTLEEAARYLNDIIFDSPDHPCPTSLI